MHYSLLYTLSHSFILFSQKSCDVNLNTLVLQTKKPGFRMEVIANITLCMSASFGFKPKSSCSKAAFLNLGTTTTEDIFSWIIMVLWGYPLQQKIFNSIF